MRMAARLAPSVPSGLRPGSGNIYPVPDCDHVVGEEFLGRTFCLLASMSPFLWMMVFSFGLDVATEKIFVYGGYLVKLIIFSFAHIINFQTVKIFVQVIGTTLSFVRNFKGFCFICKDLHIGEN